MPDMRNYTIAAMGSSKITLGEMWLDTEIVWDPIMKTFTQGDKTLKCDTDRHFNLRDVNDYQSHFMSHLTEELHEDLNKTFGNDGETAWNLLLQINDVAHCGFYYNEHEDKELFGVCYQDALENYTGDADFDYLSDAAKELITKECKKQAKQDIIDIKEYEYDSNISIEQVE